MDRYPLYPQLSSPASRTEQKSLGAGRRPISERHGLVLAGGAKTARRWLAADAAVGGIAWRAGAAISPRLPLRGAPYARLMIVPLSGALRSDRMRVWVDCTAAAHPLVLRPIIERLEARGRRGPRHRPRVRADAGDPRAARHSLTRSVGSHGGASALRQGRGRSAGRSARLARLVWARRARSGARPRLGRPRRRLRRSSASPRCRCRTTSSPACSARSPFGRRAGAGAGRDPASSG